MADHGLHHQTQVKL